MEQTKTLLLVRHAKSSHNFLGIADFDRTLNERGLADAPKMAERLKTKIAVIDKIISSPAIRAKTTAAFFAKTYTITPQELQYEPDLYLPPAFAFYTVIENIADTCNTVAVFSHNYGITSFANMLTDVQIDNIPTCGIFAVTFKGSWLHFKKTAKQFLFFDAPSLDK